MFRVRNWGRKGKVRQAHRESKRAQRKGTLEGTQGGIRVYKMWEEATEFDAHVATLQGELRKFETATLDFIDSLFPILRAPLPRVWDHVEGGLAEPIRTTVSHQFGSTAGGDADMNTLQAVAEEFEQRMESDILRPLGQWRQGLDQVSKDRLPAMRKQHGVLEGKQKKMRRVQRRSEKEMRKRSGLREARRKGGLSRLWYACLHPVTAYQTPVGQEGPEAGAAAGARPVSDELAQDAQREERDMRTMARRRKLDAATQSFNTEERLTYEQLSGLCRDAAWMKSYMVSAVLMAKELMQQSVVALGSTKQPLPSFGMARTSVSEHGAMSDNLQLAAAMPEFLTRRRPRLAQALEGAPEEPHARRATASPMELAARERQEAMSGAEPVPEVRKSAAGTPMGQEPGSRMMAPAGVVS